MSLLNFEMKKIDGGKSSLKKHEGAVLLVVNVASKCGLTPQYKELEALYQNYRSQGFTILGFPANEFGSQEPGTNEEIQSFCQTNYDVTFPLYEKIVVKGAGQHPFYKALTAAIPVARKKPDSVLEQKLRERGLLSGSPSDIMWNFEKFLLDHTGVAVARFAPDVTPSDPILVTAIENALSRRP
jgi:glutathione peroxidase